MSRNLEKFEIGEFLSILSNQKIAQLVMSFVAAFQRKKVLKVSLKFFLWNCVLRVRKYYRNQDKDNLVEDFFYPFKIYFPTSSNKIRT